MVTDSELTFRSFGLDDVPALTEIVSRCDTAVSQWAPDGWAPPPPEEEAVRLAQRLSDPGTWALMAVRGRVPAGFATLRAGDTPGSGHLSNLFVDPPHWGEGVGRGLLWRAEDAMRAAGYTLGTLSTEVANERARRFYERAGWHDTGRRHEHPDLGAMAAYERGL